MQDVAEAEATKFAKSCEDAGDYPNNLVYDDSYDHIVRDYGQRLDDQEERLFFDESRTSLCLRDLDERLNCAWSDYAI